MSRRKRNSVLPPAILLGGGANALSVARSLGNRGIQVVSLGMPQSEVRYSRFCRWMPMEGEGDAQNQWLEWLTNGGRKEFRGSVLLPCGDDGLEFTVQNRRELSDDFILYEANDTILTAMLDKAQTYSLANRAGVPAPRTWVVAARKDVESIAGEITFPCGLKPRLSHEFKKYFDVKLLVANNVSELLNHLDIVREYGVGMIVTELIPGGETRYCSYYSYLDENGMPLFHFTKRKLRQYPPGFGYGTYHMTDWSPDVAEMGLRFLKGIGLRGLACVEFKRDPRDGQLKLIECNHRFTEANELVTLSGIDLALLVYNRLTGRPLPPVDTYQKEMYMIRPLQDFLSFRSLHRRGELSWGEWFRSLMHRQHFLFFRWDDPLPTIMMFFRFITRQIRKLRSNPPANRNGRGTTPSARVFARTRVRSEQ